jgi:hypothetical protein
VASIVHRYIESIRSSLMAARQGGPRVTSGFAVAVYAFTAAWSATWIVLGPPVNRDLFLIEGGPLDWLSTIYLGAAAAMAWTAWHAGLRKTDPLSWFLLVSTAGLTFLFLDERFQFHEILFARVLSRWFGDDSLGLRNWNDAIVIGYGVAAMLVILLSLPVLLRHKGLRNFLMAGMVFYGAHTLADSVLSNSLAIKNVLEEPFKLLSVASFFLAFTEALCVREREGPPDAANGFRWVSRLAILAVVTAALVVYVSAGDRGRAMVLMRNWGDPISWLISVYLFVAALFSFLGGARRRSRPSRWAWWAVSVLLAVLAIQEGFVAQSDTLRSPEVPQGLWKVVGQEQTPMRDPHGGAALAMLTASAVGALLFGRRIIRQRVAGSLLGAGLSLLIVRGLWMLARQPAIGRLDLPLLAVAACILLVLSSQSLLLDRSPSGDPTIGSGLTPP